jgi:hypothetical protein
LWGVRITWHVIWALKQIVLVFQVVADGEGVFEKTLTLKSVEVNGGCDSEC